MVDMLKGHRDTVYCLAYESSGKMNERKSKITLKVEELFVEELFIICNKKMYGLKKI